MATTVAAMKAGAGAAGMFEHPGKARAARRLLLLTLLLYGGAFLFLRRGGFLPPCPDIMQTGSRASPIQELFLPWYLLENAIRAAF